MAHVDLEALKARVAAAKQAAEAVALSKLEAEAHKLLEEEAELKGQRFEAERKRREIEGSEREAAAREAAKGQYLVRVIDVVSFFDPGQAPSADRLPAGGVIVVRSPTEEANKAYTKDLEAKKKSHETMNRELLFKCIVDPGPEDAENAAVTAAFFTAFPGAVTNAYLVVQALNGMRSEMAKRGSD